MKLKKILKEIAVEDIRGSKEVEVTGICSNSKLVAPGNLFIAKKGNTVDGTRFIPEAVSAGAVAVLTDFYDPSLKQVTQIIHQNVQAIEPLIAAQFNHFPSDQLRMIGVTGTNGKTTTAYLVRHLYNALQSPCGLIGTIEYIIGKQSYQATHTTPDVSTNHKLLREMVHAGCETAVMEVTSHALDQGRVDNIHFDVAIFTNLSQEHLDYHGTMENYCRAKGALFRNLRSGDRRKKSFPLAAIVNCDDPYHRAILEGCSSSVITYGINEAADFQASGISLSTRGTEFTLKHMGKSLSVTTPLVGRYNVYNCLAAIACAVSQGYALESVVSAIGTVSHVPARLESVPNSLDLEVYVDFAHTPDALENVLKCLRELNSGRIITVFGCGGDRDKNKRPVMAEVCEKYSDLCIVTSDNPRTEDPDTIVREVAEGFKGDSFISEVDRHQAIVKAIQAAGPKDIVLIAGKGHETYQIFAHHTIEFDDRTVVREVCETLSVKV